MDKTISSSSFDVIVVRQPNNTFKSTPFQVAYSSNLLKNLKNHELHLYVNNQKIQIPLKLSLQNGRVLFIKKFQKRNIFSDSSDMSDDQISQRSKSRDKIIHKNKNVVQKKQKTDDYKNEKAPKPFWQFAWLFKGQDQQEKKNQQKQQSQKKSQGSQFTYEDSQSSLLSQIDEEVYEGQQTSKQPMFHLSLCKSALKKKQKKQQILNEFYRKRIPYQQFIKDPIKYLGDSELIVKIDDSLYTWQLGLAILTCRLAYGKQLSPILIDNIIKNKFTRSKLFTYFTGDDLIKLDISVLNDKKEFTINPNTNSAQTKIVSRANKIPDTEMIQKMNLKEGMNKAKFVLITGNIKQEINLKIFLWNHNEKLIISDIDGTITKSDIAGQLLTNYIHNGVTKLFAQAYKRGYKFVYLTARAIGQYNQTTKFLQSAEEDGIKLPQGPLLMSPDGYWKSLTREVIDKTPDTLKSKILATLNEIFPGSKSPLFCGFGNRQTDSVAYLKTNMNPEKIFFITPKSVISIESKQNFNTTYIEMLEKIDQYFPVFTKEEIYLDQNFDQNLRSSKKSVYFDEEDNFSSKILKTFSEDKNNKDEYDEILERQRTDSKKDQQNQKQEEKEYSKIKTGRSKSVQNNYGELNQKLQDIQKILNSANFSEQKIKSSHKINQQFQSTQQSLPKEAQYQAVDENKIFVFDNQKSQNPKEQIIKIEDQQPKQEKTQ